MGVLVWFVLGGSRVGKLVERVQFFIPVVTFLTPLA